MKINTQHDFEPSVSATASAMVAEVFLSTATASATAQKTTYGSKLKISDENWVKFQDPSSLGLPRTTSGSWNTNQGENVFFAVTSKVQQEHKTQNHNIFWKWFSLYMILDANR